MTEWRSYKLSDIADLSNGINFDKSAYTSGVKLIGVADFKDRIYPDYETLQEVDSKVVREGDFLEKGDIVFVRSNGNKELVGRCLMINKDIPVTFSGFCIRLRLRDKHAFNPVFFNYLFKTQQFRKNMTGTAVGANIQNLSQSRLGNCVVEVPDGSVQRRIAEVLSRYDALIENYQRQIKLLEEAAQRLYKEWFVDLRFPGHQSTPIINNLPQSWQSKPILEVIDFKYGKILPTKELIANGPIPVYGASKRIGYYDKANCFEAKVLVGSRGNAGHVHRTYEKVAYVTNNSFIISPQPGFNYIGLPYIYEAFRAIDFAAVCTGAAQPQLTLNTIASLQIILPSKPVVIEYIKLTEPIFERIDKAYNQIRNLSEARDRLLPKLMSGEIYIV